MDLPVKFPSETEVILEDVARFRALSPRDQIRAIQRLLNAGDRRSGQDVDENVEPFNFFSSSTRLKRSITSTSIV
jgi:hypothetical protein